MVESWQESQFYGVLTCLIPILLSSSMVDLKSKDLTAMVAVETTGEVIKRKNLGSEIFIGAWKNYVIFLEF